jgi:hypothetical protein
MTKREQLISEIEAFCSAKGLSEREFSELALGHPKFVIRLRGNAVHSRSMETAELFLANNEPIGRQSLRIQLDGLRAKVRSDVQQVTA